MGECKERPLKDEALGDLRRELDLRGYSVIASSRIRKATAQAALSRELLYELRGTTSGYLSSVKAQLGHDMGRWLLMEGAARITEWDDIERNSYMLRADLKVILPWKAP